MSEFVRKLSVVGLTLALLPLAAGAMLRAEDADEIGSFGRSATPQQAAPDAMPTSQGRPRRWLPRLRRAIGLDDEPPAPAVEVLPALPPQPAPVATSSTRSPAPPAATPPAADGKGVSTAAQKPVPDESALPPLTIRPQPPADNKPAPSGYTRSIGEAIAYYNKYGRSNGRIRLYAREGEWGPEVKLQDCFGDNIMTKFAIGERGQTQRLWFQYRDTSHRRRHRRWVMVDPGMIIRGRVIYLRAQSSAGSDIVSLNVVGNCMVP
jgi:hypothetical protein